MKKLVWFQKLCSENFYDNLNPERHYLLNTKFKHSVLPRKRIGVYDFGFVNSSVFPSSRWFPGNHQIPFWPICELFETMANGRVSRGFMSLGVLAKMFSGGFLISVSLSETDLLKIDIEFTKIRVNSFQAMSASFGDSHDLESSGLAPFYFIKIGPICQRLCSFKHLVPFCQIFVSFQQTATLERHSIKSMQKWPL